MKKYHYNKNSKKKLKIKEQKKGEKIKNVCFYAENISTPLLFIEVRKKYIKYDKEKGKISYFSVELLTTKDFKVKYKGQIVTRVLEYKIRNDKMVCYLDNLFD